MFTTEVPIVWYMGHTSSALNAAVLFRPRHTKSKTKILMMTPQKGGAQTPCVGLQYGTRFSLPSNA